MLCVSTIAHLSAQLVVAICVELPVTPGVPVAQGQNTLFSV